MDSPMLPQTTIYVASRSNPAVISRHQLFSTARPVASAGEFPTFQTDHNIFCLSTFVL